MATDRIKGITIEIEGNTTKLTEALAGVTSSLRQTQTSLKDVDKLLKLDPGNVTLLKQKWEGLGKEIKDTEEKLKTLKDAEKQMADSGLQGTAEWDNLQREIIDTEQQLKGLNQEMREFGSVSAQSVAAAGEKVKDVSAKIGEVGTTLTKNVTLPIVAIGTAAVKVTSDFDSAMSKVSAVSGATGDDLDQLRAKAREMGSKTKFSATEAAEAFNYMAMAGWKTGDMLDGIEGIMNLAAASGEDLATTSDIVTDALTAFGLKAEDSAHFADVLAAASSNANTNVSMLGESFKYAAPVAGSLGISAEDTSVALGLMANAGIKASQAGTALRTGLTNLAKPTKQMKEYMDKYHIALVKNKDGSVNLRATMEDMRKKLSQLSETEQAAAASAIFGKNSMAGWLAIVNASTEDFNKLTGAIDNCDGEAERMAETMNDNLEGQLTILKSQLQELAISIGEVIVPIVRDVVSVLQKVVDWLNSLSPKTKEMVVRIAAIVAAIGPLLIVISKVGGAIGEVMTWGPKIVSGFKTVKGLITTLGTGLKSLWAVLAANPIVLVIAAVAALVAGFIYLWNTSEEFRQFWINLWEGIKNVVETVWNAISGFFTNLWSNITTTAESAWNGFKEKITAIWEGMKSAAETIWSGIKSVVTTVTDGIGKTLDEKWENIKNAYHEHGGGLEGVAAATMEAIKGYYTFGFDALNNITGGKLNGVKQKFTEIMNGLKTAAIDVWNGIVDFVRNGVERLKNLVNFHWELPKLKLPHFKITGSFSLNPPQVPHLSVEWYKKAMNDGMILTNPTIFGASGNTLLGGGESGPEAVVGVESLRNMIAAAVQSAGGSNGSRSLTVILELDRTQFAKTVYKMNNEETQRVGVNLAGGWA